MKLLSELISGLEANYNPDYWSDNVKTEMGGLIDQLSEAEWAELVDSWKYQSQIWRRNFADAAFLSDKERVVPLLIDMLRSQESAVGAAVARTLVEKAYFWDPEVDLVTDLKRHLKSASEIEKIDLQALLNRLPH